MWSLSSLESVGLVVRDHCREEEEKEREEAAWASGRSTKA